MKITREFIDKHKTERGAWTTAQITALGCGRTRGWIERALQADHSQEALDTFVRTADRNAARRERAARRDERKKAAKVAKAANVSALETKLKQRKRSPQYSTPGYSGDVNSAAFLESFAWRQMRMRVIRHYGPRCMCCGATPQTGATMNVDHIKPRKTHPHLALEFDNLQVLCHECNHGKGNWDTTDWRPSAQPEDEQIDPAVAEFIRSIAKEK